MRRFFVIWCRELGACFLSPVAYVTMVVFLAVSGGTFMWSVVGHSGSDQKLSGMLFASIVLWLPVLVTVLSMRLFTEERKSGTIETLMTAPVTEVQIVLGKYAGALTFLVIVSAPSIGNIFLLDLISPGIVVSDVDPGAVSGGCLLYFLLSAFCIGVGMLMSLMTRNQIIAAICCFCSVCLVLLFGFIVAALPLGLENFGMYISCLGHLEAFSRGSVDLRTIVLYLTGIFFVLFVSVRVLEMKRWR